MQHLHNKTRLKGKILRRSIHNLTNTNKYLMKYKTQFEN